MVNLKDVGEFYNNVKHDKTMMWVFRLIAILLTIALVWAIFIFIKDGSKGKHVKLLWGLAERNIPKGYPDTVYKTVAIHDTFYMDRIVFAKQSSKKQAGTTIRDINAKNVAVGDNNKVGDTYYERTLSQEEQSEILRDIKKFKTAKNLPNCCVIMATQTASGKIVEQVKDLLLSNGYDAYIQNGSVSFVGSEVGKYHIGFMSENCMSVTVGIYK